MLRQFGCPRCKFLGSGRIGGGPGRTNDFAERLAVATSIFKAEIGPEPQRRSPNRRETQSNEASAPKKPCPPNSHALTSRRCRRRRRRTISCWPDASSGSAPARAPNFPAPVGSPQISANKCRARGRTFFWRSRCRSPTTRN